MILHPAVHIAYFGVFPDRPVSDDLRESFTAEKAEARARETAWKGARKGFKHEALLSENSSIEMDIIYATAKMEIRRAYKFAAREGWIQPVVGAVLLPGLYEQREYTDPERDPRAALEEFVFKAFADHTDGMIEPSLSLRAAHTEPPIAMVAHVRCVIDGAEQPFLTLSDVTASFFTAAYPRLEAHVDAQWFPIEPIDTLAYCRGNALYSRSFFTGFPHGGCAPA